MKNNWYNVNVKEEVLNGVREYLINNQTDVEIIEKVLLEKVQNLMDADYVGAKYPLLNALELNTLVKQKYIQARSRKYGTENFWDLAKRERDIAYNNAWHEYILGLLSRNCNINDHILFIGTANGCEIPNNADYVFYAMDEIKESVKNIPQSKVKSTVVGSFEDEKLVIAGGKNFDVIVALRCLLEKVDIDKFFAFTQNNLKKGGVIIASQPLKYLKGESLEDVEDVSNRILNFEKKLENSANKEHFRIEAVWDTAVERFYVIRWCK